MSEEGLTPGVIAAFKHAYGDLVSSTEVLLRYIPCLFLYFRIFDNISPCPFRSVALPVILVRI